MGDTGREMIKMSCGTDIHYCIISNIVLYLTPNIVIGAEQALENM